MLNNFLFEAQLYIIRNKEWLIPVVGMIVTGVSFLALNSFLRQRGPNGSPSLGSAVRGINTDSVLNWTNPLERRRAVRRPGNPVPVLLVDSDNREAPVHGWIIDRSVGGLRIAVGTNQVTSPHLSVRTADAPGTVEWVHVNVRSRQLGNDGWELGCEFGRAPNWSTLMLFG